jgi:uncharacterized small protein (DUF1192 family)
MSIFANSIFAKKSDPEQGSKGEAGLSAGGPGREYGIAEAIRLLQSLPNDQNADLVMRVVCTTLESLNVHLPDIIDDATGKQQLTQERIAETHAEVAELERQLGVLREEIATLEADLKETTTVKERLQMAEKSTGTSPGFSSRAETTHTPTLSYEQRMPLLPGGVRPVVKLPEPARDMASEKE